MLSMESRSESSASTSKAGAVRQAAVATLRNRRLGLWSACMMEMNRFAGEAYADEIVALGLQKGGEQAIIDRIVADFRDRGVHIAPETLCIEAAHFTPRFGVAAAEAESRKIAA